MRLLGDAVEVRFPGHGGGDGETYNLDQRGLLQDDVAERDWRMRVGGERGGRFLGLGFGLGLGCRGSWFLLGFDLGLNHGCEG